MARLIQFLTEPPPKHPLWMVGLDRRVVLGPPQKRKGCGHRPSFLWLIFLSLFFLNPVDASAQKACFNTPLAGNWINQDAATKDLVKIHIVHVCTQEETEDGLIIPGSQWFVKAWAKCYPANCVWGRVRARIGPSGSLRASLSTYAADRYLKMKMDAEALTVHVIVDYHDERRQDRDEKIRLIKKD